MNTTKLHYVVPVHTTNKGNRGTAPLILNLSIKLSSVVNFMF
jgi:hypothetical protein